MLKGNLEINQDNFSQVPILNIAAAAGINNPSFETELDYMTIPSTFIDNCKRPFVYKIIGNSMEPTIMENDLVIVDLDKQIKSGDIVVAIVDNNLVCKKFIQNSAFPYLKSINLLYENIVLSDNVDYLILGVVKGKYTPL